MAFLVVFVVGICSRTRSLAFSGSRSRFWLLLMLQAIHHFRSNFFKRRYGSKITAPNYTQKIFPTTTHFWVITPVPPVLLSNRKVLIHVHSSCKVSSYKKIFEIINSFFFLILILFLRDKNGGGNLKFGEPILKLYYLPWNTALKALLGKSFWAQSKWPEVQRTHVFFRADYRSKYVDSSVASSWGNIIAKLAPQF